MLSAVVVNLSGVCISVGSRVICSAGEVQWGISQGPPGAASSSPAYST